MNELQRRYLTLVLEKNKVMNLTAVTDFDEALVRHTEDSLAVLQTVELACKDVLDVGAGGGFPGIPLAIAVPSARVTLLDATGKKVAFLQQAAHELGLLNVTAVQGRAEELGAKPPLRETFDVCVSRGVARLSVLVELCLPFVKVGGVMVAMKQDGGEVNAALAQSEALGGGTPEVVDYTLSDGTTHALVCIEKTKKTPGEYPRRWSKMIED